MKKLWAVLILVPPMACTNPPVQPVEQAHEDVNAWLSYNIVPGELQTVLRPAMWGNGQLELTAELERPSVNEVMSFGFGTEALSYGGGYGGEEHLLPAVYDAETGKKYFLYSTASSHAHTSWVTFRPDRQIWHYEFDDLRVDVSLVLPRVKPGYLMKLELFPAAGNESRKWYVYHELRAFHGNRLFATEADYDLERGRVWFKSSGAGHGEAIGSTVDAEAVNLGLDGWHATGILVKAVAERAEGAGPVTVYFARAFGDTVPAARQGLEQLLSAPAKLEEEATAWWAQYLEEVPRLETPNKTFSRTFLWSWANFRMNRIDVPVGQAAAGLWPSNNRTLRRGMYVGGDSPGLGGAIHLMHDPEPVGQMMLYYLRLTRKTGLLSPGTDPNQVTERPGAYVNDLSRFCGILHKYVLHTGNLAFLDEDIGGGKTVLQRLEDAAEAQLPFRDEKTGLYPIDDEITRFPGLWEGKPFGLGSMHEAVTRYRGGKGTFYSDSNASIYGGFLAMAEIQELAGNAEKSARYLGLAEDLREAIQKYLWSEELGFFMDMRADGSMSDYLGCGGFITGLHANPVHRPGGLATPEQAAKLAEWCNHPDFVSDFGVLTLARSSPYFDPASYKGRNSPFNFHPSNQLPAGLYAHAQYDEAHRQLFKQFRRLRGNAGLGPRYRGEAYHGDTGAILPWRFQNYPANLGALAAVIEGVFGMRWTNQALTAHVNSPWPRARLSNLRIRNAVLDLELAASNELVASIDGKEVARSAERKVELPWELFD